MASFDRVAYKCSLDAMFWDDTFLAAVAIFRSLGLRVSVGRHVPPLSSDFNLIVYCQNDTTYLKQPLFGSCTETVTQ
jgi:hypothetical protein